MPTTTLTVARQELSARGFLTTPEAVDFATTTNIAANNSIISTELPGAGYTTDSFFGPNGSWWAFLRGVANVQIQRRVTAHTATSGTLTISGAALVAETAARSFELHKVPPNLLRRALNIASREAYPFIHRKVIDETIFTSRYVRQYSLNQTNWATSSVADATRRLRQVRLFKSPLAQNYAQNILTNGGFETFAASVFTGWVATDLTIAQSTDTATIKQYGVLRDTSSAKCTAILNTAGDLSFTVSSPTTYDGQSFTYSVWVYCTTAGRVAARVTVNNVNSDSANHGGNGWEQLVVRLEAGAALSTNLIFRIIVSSGAVIVFYVDEAIALAGPYGVAEEGDEIVRGWRLEEQFTATPTTVAGVYLVLPEAPPDRHGLRLIGTDYLSQLTAEADTVEIGTPQTEILYNYALRWLARRLAPHDVKTWGGMLAEAEKAVKESTAQHAMSLPPYAGLPYDLGR